MPTRVSVARWRSRFKALLKLVQLQFKLQDHTSMVARYEELLSYMESVTSNELQDAIQRCAHRGWCVARRVHEFS